MPTIRKFLQENGPIAGVVLFSFIFRLWLYRPAMPLWDASAYILMGKYLFSGGQVGLIEPFRPLLWPLTLGFVWNIGLDPIVVGRVLGLGFSLGAIILTYVIGCRVASKNVSALAALLLSLSPAYLFWGNSQYADIPAAFLGLCAVYSFLNAWPFTAGLLLGLVFNTKFIFILVLGVLLAWPWVFDKTASRYRNILRLGAGFAVVAGAFLLLNLDVYGNIGLPFADSAGKYTHVPFAWHQGILKSLSVLFRIEGWYLIFTVFGIWNFWRSPEPAKARLLVVLGLALFLWIGFLPTDISRFLIAALPFLCLFAAQGIMNILRLFSKDRKMGFLVLAGVLLLVLGSQLYKGTRIQFPQETEHQRYVIQHAPELKGQNIWISNPTILVFSDLKAGELIYYQQIGSLLPKLSQADWAFFDSSDIPCLPTDQVCRRDTETLIFRLRTEFSREMYFETPEGRVWGIFRRR